MVSLEINPYLRKPEELNTMQPSWLESLSPFFTVWLNKSVINACQRIISLLFFICSRENVLFSVNEGKKTEVLCFWCYCYGSWELQFRKQPQSCEQLFPRWTNITWFTTSYGRYSGFQFQNKTEIIVKDNMKISINTFIAFAFITYIYKYMNVYKHYFSYISKICIW